MHRHQQNALGIMYLTTLTLSLLSSSDLFVCCVTDFHTRISTDSVSSAREVNNTQDDISTENNGSTTIASTSFSDITHGRLNLTEVRSMCPGAVEFYMNYTDPTMYPVKMLHCLKVPDINSIRSKHRWLYGKCQDSVSFCFVLIQAARGMIVRAHMQHKVRRKHISRHWSLQGFEKQHRYCPTCAHKKFKYIKSDRPFIYLTFTNQIYLFYQDSRQLRVKLEAVQRRLDINHTSNYSGCVTTWYEAGAGTVCDQLKVPSKHVIMVSFEKFVTLQCRMIVDLHFSKQGNDSKTTDHFRTDFSKAIKLYNTTHLDICVEMSGERNFRKSCFKLLFSFHPEHTVPEKLISGLYNCSVDYYWRFQQHLDCNLKVECEDGRDEAGHCPFSSPACDGWVASGYKCYKQFTFDSKTAISGLRARDTCLARGFELASLKTQHEVDSALTLLRDRIKSSVFGLACGLESTPFMYRCFCVWSDKTVIYNQNHLPLRTAGCWEDEDYFTFHTLYSSYFVKGKSISHHFVCDKHARQQEAFLSRHVNISLKSQSPFTFKQTRQNLVTCPEGHVTHTFLSCDPKTLCKRTVCYFSSRTGNVEAVSAAQHLTNTVAMYSCSSGETEVSYSLLCDFRQDCADNSDESFCYHPPCTQFTCTNGQCVSLSKHCNKQTDCLDDSDEKNCPLVSVDMTSQNQNNAFLVNLDGRGYFTQQVMNLTDPCPGTHYRCTKEWFYCLPVYTRCNGFFDCIFHEDERDCEAWTCPGLYRCRDSTVCVDAVHMCDGWPQCPQRDDEWLCDMTCPAQCLCQGHAFLCRQPFSAHLFPQLRYLDARGSGMTPSDLRNNTYIVRLSLAQCSIRFLRDVKFPNLQSLDMSYNKMTSILMNVFENAPNLKTVIFMGNPLTSVTSVPSSLRHTQLRKIDLSGTQLHVFDSDVFSSTPEIQYLNISHSTTFSIKTPFIPNVRQLRELDIRGTTLKNFPSNLLLGLDNLANVYATDYRFCCVEILPTIVPKPLCIAPQHYLSSCDDMLRSDVFRLNFRFVAALASVGNLVCVLCRCVNSFIQFPYEGSVAVFFTSLQCADFNMGIYATIITAAHETFSGQYVHHEDEWIESVACKVAGFLALLSSEVSVLMIFLLALDHLIKLGFSVRISGFTLRSAAAACGVTWFVGILLASVPLLPGISHWGQYSQTAVCTLMLDTRRHCIHEVRYFHTLLICNCLICIVVCATLVIVYRAIPRQRVLIDSNTNPVSKSVQAMMRIAVTNVAGWFSLTIASILISSGVVGLKFNVFMAVMILPLNSAANPWLCLWHAMAYKWQRKKEQRILQLLKSKRKCMATSGKKSGRS